MTDVFDHPWLSGLFADPEMKAIWAPKAQLAHMLAFEAAWSRAGHLVGLWSGEDGQKAAQAIENIRIDPVDLADGTGRDGLCVPELVKRLKAETGSKAVHTGSTSQDVIDTATVLSIVQTVDLLMSRLQALETAIKGLDARFGGADLMARTRMQAALPMKARTRLQSWYLPLSGYQNRFSDLRPRIARVQIGGPVADRAALGAAALDMCAAVAKDLGLSSTPQSWQATREGIVEFASLLSLVSGTLGKIGQDVCLMAQQGIDDIVVAGGGGSSAMAHKQNPILAELLVTLARFNAVQVSGMHHALVHEQERSGAAWALEWMILPQMVQATGRGLVAALAITNSVEQLGRI